MCVCVRVRAWVCVCVWRGDCRDIFIKFPRGGVEFWTFF